MNYATANGTATAGSDYTAASGTLTSAAGDTSKAVSIATIDDTAPESAETVLLNLSGANGGRIATAQASGTLNDNDQVPIAITNPTLSYSNAQVVSIPIATLATLNGHTTRIASFSVPAGKGSAAIAADGQSVNYTAENVGKAPVCEPASTDQFTVPYAIQDTGTGASLGGSAIVRVKDLPGGKPTGGTVCP